MRIVVIFDNFGPYHLARLRALACLCDLVAVELRSQSREYAWEANFSRAFQHQTLVGEHDNPGGLVHRLRAALAAARPQVVLVPGWATPGALAALAWCAENGVPAILMSCSQESDFPRRRLGEWVKRQLLAGVSGALVGGAPHRAYAIKLGITPSRVLTGYNVVDNAYFQHEVALVRQSGSDGRKRLGLRNPFLLASARFIGKKNLPLLLQAYSESGCADQGVDLVLLGDGPLRAEIEAGIANLGLQGAVHLPGFVQYPDLPRYLGLALAFVHASTTEQWGLVVNEAMASGLPVIVSQACGCASDLVEPDVNGFVFEPTDSTALARYLWDIAILPPARRAAMGEAGQAIIARYSPETFAQNALRLASLAIDDPPRRVPVVSRMVNTLMSWTRERQ